MLEVIAQAAVLIACGALWRKLQPARLDPDQVRRTLTSLVYYLLLPALVIVVLWQAPLGLLSIKISAIALLTLSSSLALAWFWYRAKKTPPAATGALLLAATFPNVTYLGLPILEATFGSWARSVALQYDLFACTPFLFTVGILIARHYGESKESTNPLMTLLRVPSLWAAILGVSLNILDAPLPNLLNSILELLAAGVVPLMLLSIGLSLTWSEHWRQNLSAMLPVFVIQFLLGPLVAWTATGSLNLHGDMATAIVLEAAMPSMLLGIVLCDRYGLDSRLYAKTATLTTLSTFLVLPLWYAVLRS